MTSLKKSGLITFLTQISVFIAGFATSIILALGIEIANVYFSANKKYKLSDIISNSLVSSIGLGLVIILLFWVASTTNAFQEFLIANNITFLYLWLAVFTVPIVLLSGFFNRILLGREQIVKFNSVGISKSIFQLGLVFVFLIVLDQGVFGAVLAYIVTTVCVALLVTLFIKKLNRINFSINFGLVKESLRYGGKGYLGNVAQLTINKFDTYEKIFIRYYCRRILYDCSGDGGEALDDSGFNRHGVIPKSLSYWGYAGKPTNV